MECYCQKKGNKLNIDNSCNEAAYAGHVKCLKYARKNKCKWDHWTCMSAAEGGNIECIKFLKKGIPGDSCRWDKFTCEVAAERDDIEMLIYAKEGIPGDSCPWDKRVCEIAASKGHIGIIEYARRGKISDICPWDIWTCADAAYGGHIEFLKYVIAMGCPYDADKTLEYALRGGNTDCIEYIKNHNYLTYYEKMNANNMLGSGSDGEVYINDDKTVIKSFYNMSIYENERDILLKVKNIKGFSQIISYDDDNMLIIMARYMTDLCDISEYHSELYNKHKDNILYQIMKSIKWLHNNNIVHKDIREENILCNYTESCIECYICDFGISINYKINEPMLKDYIEYDLDSLKRMLV